MSAKPFSAHKELVDPAALHPETTERVERPMSSGTFARGASSLEAYLAGAELSELFITSRGPDGFGLGRWVRAVQRMRAAGNLPAEREAALDTVQGWSWSSPQALRSAATFRARLDDLQRFVGQHGHADVPQQFRTEDNVRLGLWVHTTRQLRQKLSEDQRAALQELPGWLWRARKVNRNVTTDGVILAGSADNFYPMVQRLSRFVARHGHSLVPSKGATTALGRWVRLQRTHYKAGGMSAERIAALEAVPNWVWSDPERYERAWQARLGEFVNLVAHFGHADTEMWLLEPGVQQARAWAVKQRRDYRAGVLDPSRAETLAALRGWRWSTNRRQFDDTLQELALALSVEAADLPPHLREWVTRQRLRYKRGVLSAAATAALSALPNWSWREPASKHRRKPAHERRRVGQVVPHRPLGGDLGRATASRVAPVADHALEEQLAALDVYLNRWGHAVVPPFKKINGVNVGDLVRLWRRQHRDGSLRPTIVAALESRPAWHWESSKAKAARNPHRA
ncbi:helicase associated domain-containing protein [Curtobacterium citreum]